MAIIKQIEGYTADYWKIISCDAKLAKGKIGLFIDKEHASNYRNALKLRRFNLDKDVFSVDELNNVDNNPIKLAYTELMRSKMVEQAVIGEDGNPVMVDGVPQTEQVETAFFVDGVSDEV